MASLKQDRISGAWHDKSSAKSCILISTRYRSKLTNLIPLKASTEVRAELDYAATFSVSRSLAESFSTGSWPWWTAIASPGSGLCPHSPKAWPSSCRGRGLQHWRPQFRGHEHRHLGLKSPHSLPTHLNQLQTTATVAGTPATRLSAAWEAFAGSNCTWARSGSWTRTTGR